MALDIRKDTKLDQEWLKQAPDNDIHHYDPQAESDWLELYKKPDVSGPK